MDAENWGPWDHVVDNNAGNNAVNAALDANENDPDMLQWLDLLQPEVPPIEAANEDSEITLTLSSNAPVPALSEGSVNGHAWS